MDRIKSKSKYSNEYKESLIRRMLPPEKIACNQLAKETGIGKSTLWKWLQKRKSEEDKGNKICWVEVDIKNNANEIVEKTEPIKVKIGNATIEVEKGFNKELLIEVMKVVAKI